MLLTGFSTSAQSAAQRLVIKSIQTQISQAQTEVASGRVSDPMQALGAKTGQLVALEALVVSLTGIMDSNSFVTSRLKAADLALEGVSASADKMQQLLVNAKSGLIKPEELARQAASLLQETLDSLNSTMNGEALFGGINSGERPFDPYFSTPPSAARTAMSASFLAAFGFPVGDPGAASITASAMTTYLTGDFAAQFEDPAWSANWSDASNDVTRSRIDENRIIDGGVSANYPALRKLVMAFTMVADIGATSLNPQAYQAMLDGASSALGGARVGVTEMRASIGVSLSQIESANERQNVKKNMLTLTVGELVDVDPYELSVRVNALQARLEASYSLTARLHELTLTKYL